MYSMFSLGSLWPENVRLINVVGIQLKHELNVRFPWDGKLARIFVEISFDIFFFFRTPNFKSIFKSISEIYTTPDSGTRTPNIWVTNYLAQKLSYCMMINLDARNKKRKKKNRHLTIYHCIWLCQRFGIKLMEFSFKVSATEWQEKSKKEKEKYGRNQWNTFVISTFIHVQIVFVLFIVRNHGIVIVIGFIFRLPRHFILFFETPSGICKPRWYLCQCHLCDYCQHNFFTFCWIRILFVFVKPCLQCCRRFTRCIFSTSCQIVTGTITVKIDKMEMKIK